MFTVDLYNKLLQFQNLFWFLADENENFFQPIFLQQPRVWWAQRFSSMPSTVQPNGRYSLKLLNTIAKIPKLCPNIMRLFSLNNWLNDKIQIAKELIFVGNA